MKVRTLPMASFAIFLVSMLFSSIPFSALANQNCTQTNQTLVSNPSTSIAGGESAVLAYRSPLWPKIPGAQWIWKSYLVTDPQVQDTVVFQKDFTLEGAVTSGTLSIAGDDYYKISVNGNQVASESGEDNFKTIRTFPISSSLFHSGKNTITFQVTNAKYFYRTGASPYTNPAGLIYALHLNSEICANPAETKSTTTAMLVAASGAFPFSLKNSLKYEILALMLLLVIFVGLKRYSESLKEKF
ncbi:MAG TPA: hypothetical protein VFM02_03515 [Candidatus Paceibacterota bacterium]|nr:hypothetical protein [Candidatus Paceibacterota bacterium]